MFAQIPVKENTVLASSHMSAQRGKETGAATTCTTASLQGGSLIHRESALRGSKGARTKTVALIQTAGK